MIAAANLSADELPAPSGSPQVLIKGQTLETLWEEGEFTEGVAVARDGKVYFSDIAFNPAELGRILVFDPQTEKVSVHVSDSKKSNGLMFDLQGRLLACCGANGGLMAVVHVKPNGQLVPIASKYNGKRFNSPNDLVVHPRGWVFFSDPRYVGPEPIELDAQSVYRIDADGSVTRVTTDIDKPNGVHVSPDGRTLYVAETDNGSTDVTKTDPDTKPGRMTLNAFPLHEDGTLGKKRVLQDFGDETGVDGMTIDQAGRIYAAVRSQSRFGIGVFDPQSGKELAWIPTPALPTNCCFGRAKDGRTLYITAGSGLYRLPVKPRGFHTDQRRRSQSDDK